MVDKEIILEGLVTGERLNSTYNQRSRKFVYKKIIRGEIQPYLDEGWVKADYKSRTHFKLLKPKEIDQAFEDEVWCTFYRMGFEEMNRDNNFKIPRYGSTLTKQIDVFGKEEQCIVLVECKAAEKSHTKRDLGVEIDQLAAIRHELAESILFHYKENLNIDKKIKVVWILALKNIDISSNDLERAEKANIKVLDETQIEYYSDLSKHFGYSSKYQFLADMFPKMRIPDLIEPVPAIKGEMGGRTFYSFAIEPEKLLKIAYIAHRAKDTKESKETYQRMAKKSRLKKIAEYIHGKKGIFPTNIVINIETEAGRPLNFDIAPKMDGKASKLGLLHLPNAYKTAWIIDGQHRLFAYSDLSEARTAMLPVIAFENLDSDIQAQLFVDINGEQVKVSKNLLHDLYSTLHWNSKNPKEKLSALTSRFVKQLNELQKSPFRDRIIKIGGRRTKTRNLTLTALVDEIKKSQLFGNVHSTKAKDITPGPLFQDDLDSSLQRGVEIISGYYLLFLKNDTLKRQWEIGSDEGGYICTNQGIVATLRVLKAVLNHIEYEESIDVRRRNANKLLEDIEKYVTPVIEYFAGAPPKVLREFKEQYGEAGYKRSTFALFKIINEKFPKFEPRGFQEYVKEIDTSNNTAAYDYLMKIETGIHDHIVQSLKEKFGGEYSQWWHKGVKEKIRSDAMALAAQEGEYHKYEKYLYLIGLKEIIFDNWDIFSELYTIDANSNDSKAKRLAWYTKVNGIRNKVDHPPKGGVTTEELAFIKRIYEELSNRLPQKIMK